jgi:hypothetical protein
MTESSPLLVFNDRKLEARYASRKIPMTTLIEAYLEGSMDIPDMDAFLDARNSVLHFLFLDRTSLSGAVPVQETRAPRAGFANTAHAV